MVIIPCTFVHLRYLEKINGEESHLRLGNNFPLNCSLAPPHVQQRQHQRQRPLSLFSIPRPNINLNWQYENTLDIEKTNAYLSSMIDTVHKNWSQSSRKKRKHIEHVYLYFRTPSLCADTVLSHL